jgi:hypothetical protein
MVMQVVLSLAPEDTRAHLTLEAPRVGWPMVMPVVQSLAPEDTRAHLTLEAPRVGWLMVMQVVQSPALEDTRDHITLEAELSLALRVTKEPHHTLGKVGTHMSILPNRVDQAVTKEPHLTLVGIKVPLMEEAIKEQFTSSQFIPAARVLSPRDRILLLKCVNVLLLAIVGAKEANVR